MGLSPAKHMIYIEEYEKCGAPRLLDQHSLIWTILDRARYESNEMNICPGFCEEKACVSGLLGANAGSDLAQVAHRRPC